MKSSKSCSLGRTRTFSRHFTLQPSVNLLQVFRPKGGRQQLLHRPDYEGAIWLGHVHGPVGAKLEKREKLCEGGRGTEGDGRHGFESVSTIFFAPQFPLPVKWE